MRMARTRAIRISPGSSPRNRRTRVAVLLGRRIAVALGGALRALLGLHAPRVSGSGASIHESDLDRLARREDGEPLTEMEPLDRAERDLGGDRRGAPDPDPRTLAVDRHLRDRPLEDVARRALGAPEVQGDLRRRQGGDHVLDALPREALGPGDDERAVAGDQAARARIDRLEHALEEVHPDEVGRVAAPRRAADLVGRALLGDAAHFEHDDSIGHREGVDGVVRDDDAGASEPIDGAADRRGAGRRAPSTSTAASGSSSSRSRGSAASARARATRCCSPPDSCAGRASGSTPGASSASRSAAVVRASARDVRRARSGNATFSSTVRRGNSAASWKQIPTRRCSGGSPSIRSPVELDRSRRERDESRERADRSWTCPPRSVRRARAPRRRRRRTRRARPRVHGPRRSRRAGSPAARPGHATLSATNTATEMTTSTRDSATAPGASVWRA